LTDPLIDYNETFLIEHDLNAPHCDSLLHKNFLD